MKRRALVIGSQVQGLTGVHNDVKAVEAALQAREFSVDLCIEDKATREGIIDAYRRLIHDTGAEDAALVYYSGHGARAVHGGAAGPRHLQCIVPTDWGEAGDFRGILDMELSKLMADLTEKSDNVTVILDCCHSARMSRAADPDELVPRSLPRAWVDGVDAFLATHEIDVEGIDVESNPLAVRLVAAEADRSAFEKGTTFEGRMQVMGLLTHAFLSVLGEFGDAPATWRALGERVREIVMRAHPEQRPQIVGPGDRILFLTTQVDRPDAVVYFEDEGRPSLRAGRLQGARVGAVYEVVRPGVQERSDADVIASATVRAIEGAMARVDLQRQDKQPSPASGSLAFPKVLPFPQVSVGLEGTGAGIDAVASALARSKYAERGDSDAPTLVVRASADGLALLDADGLEVCTPQGNDEEGAAFVMERVERWGKALRLRELENGGLPASVVRVECGRVVHGEGGPKAVPMVDGESFHLGDRPYVKVTNATKDPLYVAVFDIGVSGNVTLLSREEPRGYKLTRDEPACVLGEKFGLLEGLAPMHWPEDAPRNGGLQESLVVIAAEDPQDFTAFQTRTVARGRGPTTLEAILQSVREGSTRDTGAVAKGGRFAVWRVDFDLAPSPRADFAVDLSIPPRSLEWATRSRTVVASDVATKAPQRIAVRLVEMFIHKNQALWGKTKVRIDSMILTDRGEGDRPFFATTRLFEKVADGDRLPFDNIILYEGPIRRYLELAIWVSRDDEDADELSHLLLASAKDPELQSAVATVAALAVAAPQAAVLVAAGTAATTILHFAGKLIRTAVGNSIGLYRRSFLPSEAFGLGTHPSHGLLRAQDFSFRFSIESNDGET